MRPGTEIFRISPGVGRAAGRQPDGMKEPAPGVHKTSLTDRQPVVQRPKNNCANLFDMLDNLPIIELFREHINYYEIRSNRH